MRARSRVARVPVTRLGGVDGVPAGPTPCQQEDPELWFAESSRQLERAKALCGLCPVRAACLAGALARREPWGVWGGQLFMNGKMLTVKRRRGRPPKVPRPEDQLPVVPVPAHLVERAQPLTA